MRDYDEAIRYFTQTLRFDLIEDTRIDEAKRWVLVAPPESAGTRLLLARADGAAQIARIGDQTSGRVLLFLHTDDFWRDYDDMRAAGVKFHETPRTEPYGIVAVFEDLYGNTWDLLQLNGAA